MDAKQYTAEKRIQAQRKLEAVREEMKKAYNVVGDCVDRLEKAENWDRPRGKDDELAVATFQALCDYALVFMKLFPAHGQMQNDVLHDVKVDLDQGRLLYRKLANIHDSNGAVYDSLSVFYIAAGTKPSLFDAEREEFNAEIRALRRRIY
ncbi:unnamed protein product [Oikopleura dioica]|uniref:Uncharacterized protein n=1 Tax=Oikopleura dioica TaxID=34765 RepID=E4XT59_OIKDI|nr:unnamed protein product [Oikopleura dioica]